MAKQTEVHVHLHFHGAMAADWITQMQRQADAEPTPKTQPGNIQQQINEDFGGDQDDPGGIKDTSGE